MPVGLIISFLCHGALLVWAFWSMRAVQELPAPEVPVINAEIVTPSEFLRLKQGSETAKKLETKAKDEPKPDDSKNDTKKPDFAPPPPPPPTQEAKLEEPPPPPEPPKAAEPPPPPEPPKDVPPKAETPPPPSEPAPGPTPEEQKALEAKIEQEKQAEEAKKKAEEDAKKKAEEEARKKAEELKKKQADEARKKKLAELKKKQEEAKKKFDPNAIANLLNKTPDEAEQQKALLDKDPRKKGQQAAGTNVAAKETGKEAGAQNGHDTVLSAREQDLLLSMIDQQLYRCAQMPGAGGASEIPIVKVTVKLNPDGSLNGEPVIVSQPGNSPLFEIAARASVNAFKNCAPLRLPPDKYAAWKEFDWTFNWPKLLGLQ